MNLVSAFNAAFAKSGPMLKKPRQKASVCHLSCSYTSWSSRTSQCLSTVRVSRTFIKPGWIVLLIAWFVLSSWLAVWRQWLSSARGGTERPPQPKDKVIPLHWSCSLQGIPRNVFSSLLNSQMKKNLSARPALTSVKEHLTLRKSDRFHFTHI